jgi:hypothetical protein
MRHIDYMTLKRQDDIYEKHVNADIEVNIIKRLLKLSLQDIEGDIG